MELGWKGTINVVSVIGLGSTVSELDISDAILCLPKTKFSMFLPEVQQVLQKHNTKSIMLLGIEVSRAYPKREKRGTGN
jgi:hypothetical protein